MYSFKCLWNEFTCVFLNSLLHPKNENNTDFRVEKRKSVSWHSKMRQLSSKVAPSFWGDWGELRTDDEIRMTCFSCLRENSLGNVLLGGHFSYRFLPYTEMYDSAGMLLISASCFGTIWITFWKPIYVTRLLYDRFGRAPNGARHFLAQGTKFRG